MPVTGWKLDRQDRAMLLEQFPPAWPDIDADHVTLDAHAGRDAPLPTGSSAEIVGRANDGQGIEAMVVAIGGSTDRPDGSTYHITWSLDRSRGRKPVESNAVIAEHGWKAFDAPVPIRISPARWP